MRAIASLLLLTTLAGCAEQVLVPARPTLAEAMPGFQLACSARGLRPGTDAFEGCVRERVAAWRGTSDARGTARRPAATGTRAGSQDTADCRLSPFGGYDCEHRPSP